MILDRSSRIGPTGKTAGNGSKFLWFAGSGTLSGVGARRPYQIGSTVPQKRGMLDRVLGRPKRAWKPEHEDCRINRVRMGLCSFWRCGARSRRAFRAAGGPGAFILKCLAKRGLEGGNALIQSRRGIDDERLWGGIRGANNRLKAKSKKGSEIPRTF